MLLKFFGMSDPSEAKRRRSCRARSDGEPLRFGSTEGCEVSHFSDGFLGCAEDLVKPSKFFPRVGELLG
jgi:hypothetical protein